MIPIRSCSDPRDSFLDSRSMRPRYPNPRRGKACIAVIKIGFVDLHIECKAWAHEDSIFQVSTIASAVAITVAEFSVQYTKKCG